MRGAQYKIKEILVISLLFMAISAPVPALSVNAPDTEWEMTYAASWSGGGYDEAKSIDETRDGGYIIAGSTWSTKEKAKEVYLVKIEKDGDMAWERRLGGSGDDIANAVLLTKDGGYIIAGSTWSGKTMEDVYVIKTDWNGNKLWERVIGGGNIDRASAVDTITDGGYIIAGSTWSYGVKGLNPYIIRLDRDGVKRWEKLIEGFISEAFDVHETIDGNFIIAGYTRTGSFGYDPEDAYLIKINEWGEVIWSRTYGGNADDRAYAVDTTSDGGYILAGWTASYGAGGRDIYVIKTDADGEKEWERFYGDAYRDEARSILQTSDGGYIITGFTSTGSEEESEDLIILKLNSNGEKEWEKRYGGMREDIGCKVIEASDHSYLVAGYTHSYGEGWNDCYVIKLEPESTPSHASTSSATAVQADKESESPETPSATEDPLAAEPSGFGATAAITGIGMALLLKGYHRRRRDDR